MQHEILPYTNWNPSGFAHLARKKSYIWRARKFIRFANRCFQGWRWAIDRADTDDSRADTMIVESSDAGSEWMGEADALRRDMEIMVADSEYMGETIPEEVQREVLKRDMEKVPEDDEEVPENHAEEVEFPHTPRLQGLCGQRVHEEVADMHDDDNEEAERQQHPALDEIPLMLE
jgi:hypothetical protein